jgi:Cd2+/Zn2+-exporting ATPase
MAVVNETFEVNGIRCERCVNRLAAALRSHEGLEFASANLMGEVTLQWDEELTTRDRLVAALEGAGFRRRETAAE